ncbi:hypothetical protein QE432_005330 [Agrobacterium sp. SORGH_AS 745]|nr:hypothetical protein [Agrobacterium tumefaciens]MDQ1223702.1 hypothetical protein [Agrobacterium sp. SORGH_AS_0745]
MTLTEAAPPVLCASPLVGMTSTAVKVVHSISLPLLPMCFGAWLSLATGPVRFWATLLLATAGTSI